MKSVEVSNLVRKPTRVPVETLISDKERKTRYIRKEVQSCLEMGLLERAEDVLRKHLEKESSDTWGWKRLAEVMQEAGNVKEEAKALQKFLFFEKDADAYLRFGILLKELGKTDASEQALARAVKMKPSLTKKVKSLQETE